MEKEKMLCGAGGMLTATGALAMIAVMATNAQEVTKAEKTVDDLKDGDDFWAFDIGQYRTGRRFEIELTLVYELKGPSQSIRDRFGIEGPFIKDRLVSNAVRIRVNDKTGNK